MEICIACGELNDKIICEDCAYLVALLQDEEKEELRSTGKDTTVQDA